MQRKIIYPWSLPVFERDKHKCVKCGTKENGTNLVIHHKDKKNPRAFGSINYMNNDLINLELLCRSCHAKEHGMNLRFTKINPEIIKELREQGKTYKEIGDYLGVSRQRIHRIHQLIKKLPIDKRVQ